MFSYFPSPLLFADYLKWLEKNYNCKISSFNFRSKRSGWYDALRVVNDKIVAKGKNDAYFLGFNRNITLRESCFQCPSIGLPRKGDITIADYWGIDVNELTDKERKYGVSSISLYKSFYYMISVCTSIMMLSFMKRGKK